MVFTMQIYFFFFQILLWIDLVYAERPRIKYAPRNLAKHLSSRSLCENYPSRRAVGKTNEKEKLRMFNFVILPLNSKDTKITNNDSKTVSEDIKRSTFEDTAIEPEQLDQLVQEMGKLLILDQTQEVDSTSQFNGDTDFQMNRNKRGIKPRSNKINLESKENASKDIINPIFNSESEFELQRKKRNRY